MLHLLTEVPGPGYPGDYLCARMQGRRGALPGAVERTPAKDGSAGSADSRFWDQAAAERFWLFRQLAGEQRSVLAPLFVFFELGTVVRTLRYLAGGKPGEAERVLRSSMLAPVIRTLLSGRDGVTEVLARLERSPAGRELALAGISEGYREGGLRRCEELLRGRFLARALAVARQEDLLFFCRALVDMRNILALAKFLRWRPASGPVLLPGGRIPLPGSPAKVKTDGLARMVQLWTHGPRPSGDRLRPEHLEPVLQAHLLRCLAGRRREGGVAAACIEYVWRGYAAARECSLRQHAAGEVAQ